VNIFRESNDFCKEVCGSTVTDQAAGVFIV